MTCFFFFSSISSCEGFVMSSFLHPYLFNLFGFDYNSSSNSPSWSSNDTQSCYDYDGIDLYVELL